MKIKEAIHILKRHNDWRRGNGDIDMEQVNPTLIGEAIDVVIEFTESIIKQTETE